MTVTVNVHEAKTHLSRLLDRAARGEEIVIGRAGKPVARLVALEPASPIRFGGFEGQIDMTRFDEADEAVEGLFYGDEGASAGVVGHETPFADRS